MTVPYGAVFDPGNDTGSCHMTDQKDIVQLTTDTGSMTINVGLPISPGQINGQLVSFYPTSVQIPGLSASSIDNLVTGTVHAAVSSVNQLSISGNRWLSDAYINMPVSVPANYGGLLTGTTYYIIETGTVVTTVTSTSNVTGFTCVSTAGFYNGMPITFSGSSLGGTQLNIVYHVDTSIGFSPTTFRVIGFMPSSTPLGSMTATGAPYTKVSTTIGGPAVVLSPDLAQITMTQVADLLGAARFDVSWIRGGYRTMITNGGTGFAISNTITITGDYLNGNTPENDLVLTVSSISVIVNATATALSTGYITCDTTTGLVDDNPVVFSGTAFGNIIAGQVYFVTVINGNTITISNTIGGSPIALVDATGFMTLTDNGFGELRMASASGTPNEIVTQYYLKVVSTTDCEIFTDPLMTQPVNVDSFIYKGITSATLTSTSSPNTLSFTDLTGFDDNDPIMFTGAVFGTIELGKVYYAYNINHGLNTMNILTTINTPSSKVTMTNDTGSCTMAKVGDFVVLPEPFYFDQSIVRYNHQLYQCIISNNDPTFVFGKWELLRSENIKINALDRIFGYYEPTVNMPGLDFTQLVNGVTYPNGTYYGNAFDPNDDFTLDTILQDQPFTTLSSAEYVIQGDTFTSGYGPEELVPGVISDNLSMVVTTRPGTSWPAEQYAHVGYNVVSIELVPTAALQTSYSFVNVVQVPAQVSVGIINRATGLAVSIYSMDYSIDWINKVVILDTPLAFAAESIRIDVYEVGNGDQLEKSNTQIDPLVLNAITGFSEVVLNCNYSAPIAAGSGVIMQGTGPIEVLASETIASPDNTITCSDIGKFVLNGPVTFQGVVFGGVVEDTTYYVKTISLVTHKITISTSLGGPTFPLTAATGSMFVIIQVGDGDPWSPPITHYNGTPLLFGSYGTVTQTKASNNAVTCNSTAGMVTGSRVVFDSNMFGILLPHVTYYVQSVVDGNEFRVSATYGGPVIPLSNAFGGALVIVNDYAFGIADNGISAKIIFAASYDQTDYLTYTVFGETTPAQYGYTLPETQTFYGDNVTLAFTLSGYVDGDNPTNAIVEVNGLRLESGYTIDPAFNTITFSVAPSVNDLVAVTSYNLTDRQYLYTDYGITGNTVADITAISNTIALPMARTNVVSTSSIGDLITCDNTTGFLADQTVIFQVATGGPTIGNIDVTGTVYYVKAVASLTTFTISSTLVAGVAGPVFDPGNSATPMVATVGGTPAVRITTGIPHDFIDNDIVHIDGTTGSIQLNNNVFYAKKISNTIFDLYSQVYDPVFGHVNYPVTDINTWGGGGYAWKDGIFTMVNTYVTNTYSSGLIQCNSVAGLTVDTPVVFSGNTFGNIVTWETYYILAINTFADTITVSQTYQGAEFVLATDSGTMGLTQWAQTNVDRLWVTVNGERVRSSSLRINPTNNVSILTTISPLDTVTITRMMPSATPDELVYVQNVNKNSVGSVYRAGPETRTWLVRQLDFTNEVIYVNDLTKITNTIVQNATAPAIGLDGHRTIGLLADKRIISQVIVYNTTTSTTLNPSSYFVATADTAPVVNITAQVSTGDTLIITTIEGNLIYVFGEQIRFTIVDFVANSISGLQRGTNGTGVRSLIPKYTEVYGVLSENRMTDPAYGMSWTFPPFDNANPLQISSATGAIFLRTSNNQ